MERTGTSSNRLLMQVSRWASPRMVWNVGMWSVVEPVTQLMLDTLQTMRGRGETLPERYEYALEYIQRGQARRRWLFRFDAAFQPVFDSTATLPERAYQLIERAAQDVQHRRVLMDVWTYQDVLVLFIDSTGINGLQFIPGDLSATAQYYPISTSPPSQDRVMRRWRAHLDQFADRYVLSKRQAGQYEITHAIPKSNA